LKFVLYDTKDTNIVDKRRKENSDRVKRWTSPRVMILGLDGATWTVMKPMLERGELPAIRQLMEAGVHGPLESLKPTVTPRIWASIDTGKVPEKHGIVDFYTANLRSLRAKAFWEILSDRGWRVGIYSWLNTWPPPVVDGFVIPGWLARTPLTHPESLDFVKRYQMEAMLRRGGMKRLASQSRFVIHAWRHGLRFATVLRSAFSVVQEKIFRLSYKQTSLNRLVLWTYIDRDLVPALVLKFSPELLMYYTQAPDTVAHYYWKYYQPELFEGVDQEEVRRFSGAIEQVYREVDDCLAKILASADDETIVCCVSDHGLRAAPAGSSILTGMKVSFLADQLHLPYEVEGFKLSWECYLRPRVRREDDKWREELSASLASFVVQKYKVPLFDIMPEGKRDFVGIRPSHRLTELRNIPERSSLGSLIVEHAKGQCRLGDLFVAGDRPTGEHDPEGIIVLKGPGVREGERITASVVDVAPTLLALLGLPVGGDMDGRVIIEAIRPDYLEQHPVTTIPTYDDEATARRVGIETHEGEELVRERLRGLGYLS
jgi:hypothetical protein